MTTAVIPVTIFPWGSLSCFCLRCPSPPGRCQKGIGDDRLRLVAGGFVADPLPNADVVRVGHILQDWNLEQKKQLLRTVCEALPSGGAIIATSPPRIAPDHGPPLWEMSDAGQDEFDPQAQPAPDCEFEQRFAW
jgi:hypothetical protein